MLISDDDLTFTAAGAELLPVNVCDGQAQPFDLAAFLDTGHPAAFVFQLQSASFVKEGVLPGDYLVVRRDLEPEEGDIIVIYQNGRYQLKIAKFDTLHNPDNYLLFGTVFGVFRLNFAQNKG